MSTAQPGQLMVTVVGGAGAAGGATLGAAEETVAEATGTAGSSMVHQKRQYTVRRRLFGPVVRGGAVVGVVGVVVVVAGTVAVGAIGAIPGAVGSGVEFDRRWVDRAAMGDRGRFVGVDGAVVIPTTMAIPTAATTRPCLPMPLPCPADGHLVPHHGWVCRQELARPCHATP